MDFSSYESIVVVPLKTENFSDESNNTIVFFFILYLQLHKIPLPLYCGR
jgi:hypothetical protein